MSLGIFNVSIVDWKSIVVSSSMLANVCETV